MIASTSKLVASVNTRSVTIYSYFRTCLLASVESKTRAYHGRVESGRAAGRRGGFGEDWVPTELFSQETRVPRTLQSIEDTSLERLSRSTNKRNSM